MAGSDNSASNRPWFSFLLSLCRAVRPGNKEPLVDTFLIRWDLVIQHVEVLNIGAIWAVDLRQVNV
jgi:hypothetical protein